MFGFDGVLKVWMIVLCWVNCMECVLLFYIDVCLEKVVELCCDLCILIVVNDFDVFV